MRSFRKFAREVINQATIMGTRYRKEYEVAGRMVRGEELNMEEYLKY